MKHRQIQHDVTITEDDMWLIIRNRQSRARRLSAAMRTITMETDMTFSPEIYIEADEVINNHKRVIAYLESAMS